MSGQPIDDIEEWSKRLSPWRQDCLRRLAMSDELTDDDLAELLALIKVGAGFDLETPPPAPVAFTKAHFGSNTHQPIVLKGISNVQNVNRLIPQAALTFCPKSLTVIYGRNGSGKSGFVRILRTACRTRVENAAKLRVLADVYGDGSVPQSADIIIDAGSGDTPVKWTPGMATAPALMQVAIFDTASAQLYVDGGNQIRFLPFGLALPHRLNAVSLTLKEKLEAERETAVGNKVSLTAIAFSAVRSTKAQAFEKSFTVTTTEAAIKQAATFSAANQARLDEVTNVLAAGAATAADVSALVTWITALTNECQAAENAFNDSALAELITLKTKAIAGRKAAQLAAGALFTNEPLPGVGSDSWRALWEAARNYSISEAYVGGGFPVTAVETGDAACVLCQQPLVSGAAVRMTRFQKYMDDTLDVAATQAEKAVAAASQHLTELKLLIAADFDDRSDQVRKRDPGLADALVAFQNSAVARRGGAISRLAGKSITAATTLVSPVEALKALEVKLKTDKDALVQAANTEERAKLVAEKAEFEDLKVLAANRDKLLTRQQLLLTDAAYASALSDVQTRSINDPKTGVLIIVMQRLHEDDLIGHVMQAAGWEVIKIPIRAEEDLHYQMSDNVHCRFNKGNFLQPKLFGQNEFDDLRNRMGTANFYAQYQQSPVPPAGNLFDWKWFRPALDPPEFSEVIMSLDVAATKAAGNYSAFTVWGHRDRNWYLIAAHRYQYELPEVRKRLLQFDEHYRPDLIVIDGIGVGRGLVQELRSEGKKHVHDTKGDGKISDAESVAPMIEGGRVFYLPDAPGLAAFRDEVIAFPKGKYNDQVVSMVQLLKRASRVVSTAQDTKRPERKDIRSENSRTTITVGPDISEAITDLVAAITPEMKARWGASEPRDWTNESFAISESVTTGYCVMHGSSCDLPDGTNVTITAEYLDANEPVVKEQLQKAGVRLARLLDVAFGN